METHASISLEKMNPNLLLKSIICWACEMEFFIPMQMCFPMFPIIIRIEMQGDAIVHKFCPIPIEHNGQTVSLCTLTQHWLDALERPSV